MFVPIQTGNFIATAAPMPLVLRQDVDLMFVTNITEAGAANANHGVEYFWQRGMTFNNGVVSMRNAGATAMNTTTCAALGVNGFQLFDTSTNPVGALNTTITAITGATPPLVQLTSTAGLQERGIIRLMNVTTGRQFSGMDFTIDTINPNTSFNLSFAPTLAVPATNGSLRPIAYNPIFYPPERYISSIVNLPGLNACAVQLTVTHTYTVGQAVRFAVAPEYGMTQINGQIGNIIAVVPATNTIVVDIDATAFTAFAYPTSAVAAGGVTFPQVIPVGEVANAAISNPNLLDDATENIASIGILLGTGITSPAGTVGQQVFWIAGKSI